MGEFPPPLFLSPDRSFFSYPSSIEILFYFSDIITKIPPPPPSHFKILDPSLFLELVHLGLCSGKVWENRFFLYCMTLVDPYRKLLLTP